MRRQPWGGTARWCGDGNRCGRRVRQHLPRRVASSISTTFSATPSTRRSRPHISSSQGRSTAIPSSRSKPHAGGVLPILIGRIDHGWRVRKETKHLAQAPSTYLRRFTYDTIAHSKPIMEFVISMVGADRVMVGSDYCYDMGYTQPVQFVDQLNLSPEDRRMILGGTAARLLKLAA